MKTTLYYFSGTGNSLVAARRIAGFLGDTDLVPIAAQSKTGVITAPPGRIGIICPVYDMGVPVIVREFVRRLIIDETAYVFAVLTYGGRGASALKMVSTGLRELNNRGLSAGFMIKMPGNFPPLAVPPSGKKRDDILAAADRELDRVAGSIKEHECRNPGLTPISSLLQMALYGSFAKGVHETDKKFSVSDACTSCGTCVSVCPTRNISLADGRPVWQHRCELCCGCLNFCPVQAIDLHLMFGTRGRGRYHHPEITVADMKRQAEREL